MLDSALFKLLNNLDSKDFQQLNDLVNCKFIVLNSDSKTLFKYICEHRNNSKFDCEKLAKKFIQKKLFRSGEKGDAQLRRTMTSLKSSIEEYISIQHFRKNEFLKKKALLEFQKDNSMPIAYDKNLNKMHSILEKRDFKSEDYHVKKCQLLMTSYYRPFHNVVDKNIDDLKQAMEHLDAAYFTTKFKLSAEIMERQIILGDCYEIPLIDQCLYDANLRLSFNEPAYHLYHKIVDAHFRDYSLDQIEELVDYYFDNIDKKTKEDQHHIFLYLQNILIRKYRKGDLNALAPICNMYRKGVELEILSSNGIINSTTFLNIVITGCLAKEYKWVKRVISGQEKKLGPSDKQEIQEARALYYFYKKDYLRSQEIIRAIKFPRNHFSFRLKSILIRTYFELLKKDAGYYELLDAEIENFYRYLKKSKKASAQKIEGFKNFLHITKRILGWKKKGKFPKKNQEKLIALIDGYEEIPQGLWLKEKILEE